ncbi:MULTISPECIES: FAD-dependent monooxygenase [Alphaproteobacteria]|uniref:Salicylate hydroxylase n=2 Tax=Alphaproteobacteria TaxID=28211 RepID=A0A512HHJ6_9HYPH|nr:MULTISPECIES: FAD-dependent monooxygenase [Alphaproteobacteria]GEO84924.1 salicylate hydroxylase [Ciceribacter naphthalenivorans]GLR22858.1 salicylate hydroxylase [Ciceribacter naphthalenivorans]GLT05714.1 salicylate hydroxylase [Sphingomonas psychrolutea]
MSIKSAAVIGAGMAGLTAALSFARHGIRSEIFEQAPQITEVGAGLQISPNAARILAKLGALPEIERHWCEPNEVRLASGVTLKPLAAVATGAFARKRWGAPYGVLHRSTLQQALLTQVLHNPLCRLHLGCRLEQPDAETIGRMTGSPPELIVGADGAWSTARKLVAGSPQIRFSGNIAWRFTVPSAGAPSFLDPVNVTAYLGPNTHLVAYPLKEIDGFNIVAIAAGNDPGETWSAVGSAAQRALLLRQFAGWNIEICTLLASFGNATFWPLYEALDGRWQNGRDTVLIGDAAHAMMPFSAQGAAMAIEDAFELAGEVSGALPLPEALAHFETNRKARAARVRQRGAFNKFAYHARGPVRLGRDIVLSLRSPQSLAGDLDWLYGYRAKG